MKSIVIREVFHIFYKNQTSMSVNSQTPIWKAEFLNDLKKVSQYF